MMVGERILVKPKNPTGKTKSGLYLPPTAQANEEVQSEYIAKGNHSYPIPTTTEDEEVWKKRNEAKYVPLQAHIDDLAIYLKKRSLNII